MAKKESKGARAVINPDSKKEGGPDVRPIIIIKKVKKVSGGHHGGAWKVAYADFVTAMMAFFLLLWLLNVTTENQKLAISNFFDPTHPQIAESLSGAGGVMAGTTIATEGAMSSTMQEIRLPQNSGKSKNTEHRGDSSGSNLKSAKAEELKKELLRREDERFAKAKRDLERQIENTPELAELKKHLMIDITPEGLRIQIVDQEGEPMFPSGSAQMFEKTKNLVTLAAGVIKSMPNNISVRGHTDSHQYKEGAEYTNWELSADRANATRRVIETAGIPNARISNVMGKGDTEHLVADNPLDPKNRRISIILEREDLQTMLDREGEDAAETIGAPDAADEVQEEIDNNSSSEPAYKRTQGDIYFP